MNRQTRFLRLSMKQNDRSCVWVTDWYENTGKSELWGISRTAPKVRFKWILEIVGRSDEDGGVAPGKSTKYLLQLLHLHFLIMRLKLKHWYYRGLLFLSQLKKNIKISNRRHQEEVVRLERRFLEEKVKADRQWNELLLEWFLPLLILASLFLTAPFSAVYSSSC